MIYSNDICILRGVLCTPVLWGLSEFRSFALNYVGGWLCSMAGVSFAMHETVLLWYFVFYK